MTAKIASVTTFIAMSASAIWADSVSVRPTLFRYGLFADFICVEIVGDLDEGGEVVEVYHGQSRLLHLFIVQSTLFFNLKAKFFLQKIRNLCYFCVEYQRILLSTGI